MPPERVDTPQRDIGHRDETVDFPRRNDPNAARPLAHLGARSKRRPEAIRPASPAEPAKPQQGTAAMIARMPSGPPRNESACAGVSFPPLTYACTSLTKACSWLHAGGLPGIEFSLSIACCSFTISELACPWFSTPDPSSPSIVVITSAIACAGVRTTRSRLVDLVPPISGRP